MPLFCRMLEAMKWKRCEQHEGIEVDMQPVSTFQIDCIDSFSEISGSSDTRETVVAAVMNAGGKHVSCKATSLMPAANPPAGMPAAPAEAPAAEVAGGEAGFGETSAADVPAAPAERLGVDLLGRSLSSLSEHFDSE
jgi:hypothetical protein